MKKTSLCLFFSFVCSLSATISFWPGDHSCLLPPLTGNIQIQQRQLLIDGAPFVMKGVCYEPMRKGAVTVPDGIMTIAPTAEDLVTIEQDFQLMQAAGINTIRTYRPILDLRILSLLQKYQLHTIVPICVTFEASQDAATLEKTVELLQNDPSTLIWEIGNEWNWNYFYTRNFNLPSDPIVHGSSSQVNGLNNKQCLEIIKNVALFLRNKDRLHPISTDILFPPKDKHGVNPNPNIYAVVPDFVDLYGINYYNGLSFGHSFDNPKDTSAFLSWQKCSSKPLYLGEYGAPAWNKNIDSYDPDAQATAINALTSEILDNLSANNPHHVLIGGCVFEWCDEWWSGGSGEVHKVDYSLSFDRGGPWPAHCYNQDWFGLVTAYHHPRPSYYKLQTLFKNSSSESQQP